MRVARKFTIVVAEDNANDRKLLHLALQRNPRDVDVRYLADGTEVIDYLESRGRFGDREKFPIPDLIIVDLKMPQMDGLEVIKWMRKEPRFSRTPVVMLSGSGLPNDVAEAYRLGANSYLQKPSDFAELIRKLGVLIDYWMMTERPGSDSFMP